MFKVTIIMFMLSIIIFQQLIYMKLTSLESKSINIEHELKRMRLKVDLLNNSVMFNFRINSSKEIKK